MAAMLLGAVVGAYAGLCGGMISGYLMWANTLGVNSPVARQKTKDAIIRTIKWASFVSAVLCFLLMLL